ASLRRACGRAPRPAGVRRRSRRPPHPDAPGGVPGRGHLRPATARGGRARAAAVAGGRTGAAQRALPRPGARPGGCVMGALLQVSDRLRFELPPELEASAPPEARGLTRDAVRLMVAYRSDGRLVHTTFSDLPRFLDDGDLLVVNTSGTMPAAVDASLAGESVVVHLSTQLPAGLWLVEVRRPGAAGTRPTDEGAPGTVLALA